MSKQFDAQQQDYEIDLVELPTVKNSLNAYMFPKTGERSDLPSLTVPDDTMSVREILYRYARGLGFEGAKTPMFEEDGYEMPDVSNMDYSEIEEMYQRNLDVQKTIQSRLKDMQNAKDVSQQPVEAGKAVAE